MSKTNDLTDKQILAMARKTPKVKKRVLFKEYAVTYVNLGLENRDAKMMKKELPAIAKRGAELVMNDILRKTTMPGKLKSHQQPLITIIIYAGIMEEVDGHTNVLYPDPLEDYGLEEV